MTAIYISARRSTKANRRGPDKPQLYIGLIMTNRIIKSGMNNLNLTGLQVFIGLFRAGPITKTITDKQKQKSEKNELNEVRTSWY